MSLSVLLAGGGTTGHIAPLLALADCLRRHGVPPQQLVLEIPESVLASGDVNGIESLIALRRLGVGVAVDDFGTGYSSISYLRRLPIDTVKVDPSIISDLAVDEAQVRFVGAILRLIEKNPDRRAAFLRGELDVVVAPGRQFTAELAAEHLVYQTVDGMNRAMLDGQTAVTELEESCFTGEYLDGNVDEE